MEQGFDGGGTGRDSTARAIRLIAWIGAIPALAIAYYFAVALPDYNEARLELERQRHFEELKRSEETAAEAKATKELLEACLQKASDDFFSYLKLNGTELKGGKLTAPQHVAVAADKRRNDDRDACLKQYGGR